MLCRRNRVTLPELNASLRLITVLFPLPPQCDPGFLHETRSSLSSYRSLLFYLVCFYVLPVTVCDACHPPRRAAPWYVVIGLHGCLCDLAVVAVLDWHFQVASFGTISVHKRTKRGIILVATHTLTTGKADALFISPTLSWVYGRIGHRALTRDTDGRKSRGRGKGVGPRPAERQSGRVIL